MKMKIEYPLDIVVGEEILKIDRRKDFVIQDIVTALILSYLPEFLQWVESVRSKLLIDSLPPSSKELSKDDLEYLRSEIGMIRDRLHLHPNWHEPLFSLVLTGTLYIPLKFDPLAIVGAGTERFRLGHSTHNLRSMSYVMYLEDAISDLTRYPRIEIRENITTNQLHDWIDSESTTITRTLASLNNPIVSDIENKTLLWGNVAWLWSQENGNTWAELAIFIKEMIDSGELFDDKTMAPPTSGYLRNAYVAFDRLLFKYE